MTALGECSYRSTPSRGCSDISFDITKSLEDFIHPVDVKIVGENQNAPDIVVCLLLPLLSGDTKRYGVSGATIEMAAAQRFG